MHDESFKTRVLRDWVQRYGPTTLPTDGSIETRSVLMEFAREILESYESGRSADHVLDRYSVLLSWIIQEQREMGRHWPGRG